MILAAVRAAVRVMQPTDGEQCGGQLFHRRPSFIVEYPDLIGEPSTVLDRHASKPGDDTVEPGHLSGMVYRCLGRHKLAARGRDRAHADPAEPVDDSSSLRDEVITQRPNPRAGLSSCAVGRSVSGSAARATANASIGSDFRWSRHPWKAISPAMTDVQLGLTIVFNGCISNHHAAAC
jgi:hypothetical protein